MLHLLTHEFYPTPGGAGSVTAQLANAAAADNRFPVKVWAPSHPDLPRQLDGYAVEHLPVQGKQGWPDRLRHTAAIRSRMPELRAGFVHLVETGALRSWMDLASRFNDPLPPLGITLHGSDIYKVSATPARRKKFRLLASRASWIHVLSEFVANLFAETFPEIKTPIRITGGAPTIDAASLRPAELQPDQPESPQPSDSLTVLCVGRIHPRKGQLALVEAIGSLPEDLRQRITVLFVGPFVRPGYAQKIRKLASLRRVKITLTGALPRAALEEHYAQADCFAFPSQPYRRSVEGLGLACLDASLRGLPVVASRLGGIPEAVLHQQTGLLCHPFDPLDMASAFQSLLEKPDYRMKLGSQGQAFASSLSWSSVSEALYGSLAQGTDV